jgi:single-strand DNA-binding protein
VARHLNRVFLIGNLTREPELRYTPNDTAVASFGLALNRSYQDQSGEWQEETDFVDITVWDRQAENASQYLEKGSRVFLEGRLDHQTWETDEGERRSKLEVTARNLIFLDAPGGMAEGEEGDAEEILDDFEDFDVEETEDDIPF